MTDKNAYATLVAQSIQIAEADADRHLAQLGQTLTDMAGGRVAAGLGADVGLRGLNLLARAVSQAVESRKSLVMAHSALARDGTRIGAAWTMIGPVEKLDPDDKPESPLPQGRLLETV